MSTYKQKEANRANAHKSTGPTSETGKSVACMNAHKHGLTAKTIVIGNEDPKAFEALRAQLEAEFNPRPGLESDLVERLAGYIWRMRRIPVFEAAIVALGAERAVSRKRQGKDYDCLLGCGAESSAVRKHCVGPDPEPGHASESVPIRNLTLECLRSNPAPASCPARAPGTPRGRGRRCRFRLGNRQLGFVPQGPASAPQKQAQCLGQSDLS